MLISKELFNFIGKVMRGVRKPDKGVEDQEIYKTKPHHYIHFDPINFKVEGSDGHCGFILSVKNAEKRMILEPHMKINERVGIRREKIKHIEQIHTIESKKEGLYTIKNGLARESYVLTDDYTKIELDMESTFENVSKNQENLFGDIPEIVLQKPSPRIKNFEEALLWLDGNPVKQIEKGFIRVTGEVNMWNYEAFCIVPKQND